MVLLHLLLVHETLSQAGGGTVYECSSLAAWWPLAARYSLWAVWSSECLRTALSWRPLSPNPGHENASGGVCLHSRPSLSLQQEGKTITLKSVTQEITTKGNNYPKVLLGSTLAQELRVCCFLEDDDCRPQRGQGYIQTTAGGQGP